MSLSLFQLASMVQNNVSAGLHGQQNFTYDLEQLQDELRLERNSLLKDMESKGGEAPPYDACAQPLNALPLRPLDYAQVPAGVAELAGLEDVVRRPVLGFTFPSLVTLSQAHEAVRYVGPIARLKRWRVATKLAQVEYDRHQKLRKDTPLVYFDPSSPGQGWVFGCPVSQRTISMTGIFEDPLQVGYYPPNVFTTESPYAMTEPMARAVVQKLTNKYISQYGRLSVRPNDGTAQV
ncbi:hypothetical protein [Hymenobacter siberiensis]|uniref:hypothetical protein n=1 Tax=Hymenobacter siberiensis TaxID=2848396 RepID=UPI001C1E0176|nr:hypothetical protein [Hymenobacter siberiensis]